MKAESRGSPDEEAMMYRKLGVCVLSPGSWGLMLLCLVLSGCAFGLVPLSADPIDSQVMDIGTGAPVEGAVVLAYWELHAGSLSGDRLPCGSVNVEDTVTDKDGRFHLPGWGPTMPGCGGQMRQGNPHLYVFKPGYYYMDVPNGIPDTRSVMTTHNAWRDQPLTLRAIQNPDPAKKIIDEIVDQDSLETSMTIFMEYMPAQCNWKKVPNMIRALALQDRVFSQAGHNHLGMVDILIANDQSYQQHAPQCGSTKKFIEGLLK